jgi:hypothetical protein
VLRWQDSGLTQGGVISSTRPGISSYPPHDCREDHLCTKPAIDPTKCGLRLKAAEKGKNSVHQGVQDAKF